MATGKTLTPICLSEMVFNEALTRAWPGEVIPEHCRKGDAQSNGEVERTIQTLTSQVRAMKIALSENIGAEIPDDAPVVSWMIEYATLLLRRHLVGTDGRTAYERWKGRGDRRRLREFGETVLYKPLKDSADIPRPLEERFKEGTVWGISEISGETLVGVGEEILRANEARRMEEGLQWNKDAILNLKATAVQPNEGSEITRIRTRTRLLAAEVVHREPEQREGAHDGRQIYLKKGDFEGPEGAGYTDGCPRCRSMRFGMTLVGAHSAACRQKMTERLRKSTVGQGRVAAAEERMAVPRAAPEIGHSMKKKPCQH